MAESKVPNDEPLGVGEDLERIEAEGAAIDEVAELTWLLLDREITDQQMTRLEELLRDNQEARDTYLKCVQIHVDLAEHFELKREQEDNIARTSKGLPVLDFLNESLPPSVWPLSEDAGS